MAAYPPLVQSLLRPEAYPHRPRRVRLVETHISYVFLAGPYAYKVKKPVDFGFLDYSTLEKRRYFCEEEVRLNRELCPDTHLGVVPITRTADGFAVGGDGEAVEYAVLMRRLPEARMLDRLVRRGRVKVRRASSPQGGSTFITSAPWSARYMAAAGAAHIWARSITRIRASGSCMTKLVPTPQMSLL